MQYVCIQCQRRYAREEVRWRCECGGVLDITGLNGVTRSDIDRSSASLWRYSSALPAGLTFDRVSYDEGWTPLLDAPALGPRVHLKLDYLFPSGSFKDRGTSVLMSELKQRGVRSVMEDSSGNAGASLATYAARAGLACEIFVPADTSAGKLVQIHLSGASLRRITGTREDTAAAALTAAVSEDGPFYASHNWHPLFIEGVKTMGYEIWEQLGFRAPASVIAPAGNGSIILGVYRAFSELLHRGEISNLPRIIAVQTESCAPLAAAFEAGFEDVPPIEKRATLAEGIASARPIRGRQILHAIRASGGAVVTVPEMSIRPQVDRLASLGFFVEPTSAVVSSALPVLLDRGILNVGEESVLVLTGSGLKATERLVQE